MTHPPPVARGALTGGRGDPPLAPPGPSGHPALGGGCRQADSAQGSPSLWQQKSGKVSSGCLLQGGGGGGGGIPTPPHREHPRAKLLTAALALCIHGRAWPLSQGSRQAFPRELLAIRRHPLPPPVLLFDKPKASSCRGTSVNLFGGSTAASPPHPPSLEMEDRGGGAALGMLSGAVRAGVHSFLVPMPPWVRGGAKDPKQLTFFLRRCLEAAASSATVALSRSAHQGLFLCATALCGASALWAFSRGEGAPMRVVRPQTLGGRGLPLPAPFLQLR